MRNNLTLTAAEMIIIIICWHLRPGDHGTFSRSAMTRIAQHAGHVFSLLPSSGKCKYVFHCMDWANAKCKRIIKNSITND